MAEYRIFRNGVETEHGTLSYKEAASYCDKRWKEAGDVTYSVANKSITTKSVLTRKQMLAILNEPINFSVEFPTFT